MMTNNSIYNEILELHRQNLEACLKAFRNSKEILITTHLNPDGDAIGSEIALAQWLKSEGKKIQIVNSNPTPGNCRFLDIDNEIQVFNPECPPEIGEDTLICFLDVGEWERLGKISNWVKSTKNPKICIDHHQDSNGISDISWVDTDSAATGEMIFLLLKKAGAEITYAIALSLYTAIATDTGSFRYANTRSISHQISAELLSYGVQVSQVESAINERNTWNKMWIFSDVLSNLKSKAKGKIAWTSITLDQMNKTGAKVEDLDGLVELFRTIDGVIIGILFREMDKNRTKLNFRSKGNYNMAKLAGQFGGGGHIGAAGAVVEKPMSELITKVLEAAEQLVNQ